VEREVVFYSDATFTSFHDADFGRDVKWDTDLASGYESRVPPASAGRRIPRRGRDAIRPDLFRAVMGMDADVLWLHAYHLPTSLALAYAFLATGRPVVLRGERNKQYLKCYGAREAELFFAPYSVPKPGSRPSRESARRELGIDPTVPVVLFVGKLIERKQPLQLLQAWAHLSKSVRSCLLFAGDGPLRPAIDEAVSRQALESVVVTGFLSESEMPMAYAAADVFVLTSTGEPWGLVVNEALMAGLPVIVSSAVGSAADLVDDGWNGYLVSPSDQAALTERLGALLANPQQREALGERGRVRAIEYSLERTVDGLVAAFLGDQLLAPAHRTAALGGRGSNRSSPGAGIAV
jgi:glycosyltransferase involved in cell wall biosynthesis